ncbi:MAG: OmpA family protein [Phaeovulum sp.]|uniref:OmpA family protein n=1 Tax=Phaeovulum sp. TaxID=2934796 RepID=UPI00272F2D30|nr:OmpA family protein [Phaeovulum sp.]MDP2063669.1 OmpA family protein [Phaeovulum sp.]MDP3860785.1 OmpA family protein [Phaeovulum sp.]
MSGKRIILTVACSAVLVASCTNPEGALAPNRTQGGATIGAMLGGFFGATRGGNDALGKAAVGAVAGAAIGGLIGQALDKQAAELDRDLGNGVGVVNTGSALVVTMPQDLLFTTDSTALRPELQRDLQTLATSLLRYPDTMVEVVGHTDNTGAAGYNQTLSQGRANTVAGVLANSGVPFSRITAYGRGEDQPIASNLTPEGRAQNRRVEIIIRPNS